MHDSRQVFAGLWKRCRLPDGLFAFEQFTGDNADSKPGLPLRQIAIHRARHLAIAQRHQMRFALTIELARAVSALGRSIQRRR